MKYSILSAVSEKIPKLAWIAKIPKSPAAVTVTHGKNVEVFADGIVEGCWDGEYQEFGFCEDGYLFGSGLKIEHDRVVVSASDSLTDRLLYVERESYFLCSNSQPLILAASGARLNPFENYAEYCSTSLKGIRKYDPTLPTVGEINRCNQVFGHRLVFAGDTVTPRYRKPSDADLSCFDAYASALNSVLSRIQRNCEDSARQVRVDKYATLSTGYDSSAVTALLKDDGLKRVFTTKPDENTTYLEDGTPLAEALGLEAFIMQRVPPDYDNELLSLAGTIDGRESIFEQAFNYLEQQGTTGALFTGYHGDKVWDIDTPEKYWHSDILRGDTSGLNLCEVRLQSGFMNVAVPFIFAEQIVDLMKLSRSTEMKPWSVANNYDRPLPRRFAEEAGLSRSSFGLMKKVVLSYEPLPLNTDLCLEFTEYYKQHFGRAKFYANSAFGNIDYAAKLSFGMLNIDHRGPQLKKRLNEYLIANQIYIFSNNRLADRYVDRFGGDFFA